MKKIFFIAVVISLVAMSSTSSHARNKLGDEEKLQKGWIVSNISYGADESIVIVEVKALINASAGKVWNLLTNVNRWSKWMPVMSRGWIIHPDDLSKLPAQPEKRDDIYKTASASQPASLNVNGSGKTSLTTFEEFDLPWPINNDWVLRKYHFDATASGNGHYKVSWKQLFKDTEGRGGKWELSQYNGNTEETLFRYHYRVKRKEGVPKKIFEVIIGKTVDRFIGAIRRNVEAGKKA